MNELNVVILVSNNNCIEIGEELKIVYYFVGWEDSYFGRVAASVQ
jgi:hypothetical protein